MRFGSRLNSKLDKSIVKIAWFRETNPTVYSVLTNSQNCKTALSVHDNWTELWPKLRQYPRHLILVNYSLMTAQINPNFLGPYMSKLGLDLIGVIP